MLATSTRASVAAALEAAGTNGLSGEALAAQLGISRVAVSRHVATLRSLGYEIASAPRAGYRLLSAPDVSIPEEVAPRLRHSLWTRCDGGIEVGSTNDDAKRLARAGAAEGTLVVAARQTGGRGRFGRVWDSPPGGVYASMVLRPPCTPAEVSALSLVVGLGVARSLEALGVTVGLKWPNDIELGGRKLGGILLEMAAEADRVEWVVAGIGINVADTGREGSAWLRESVPSLRVPVVAASVLDGVAASYVEFVAGGFEPIRTAYEERLTSRGAEVSVRDLAGATVAFGRVVGVDCSGALLLERAEGTTAIHAGEVTLRDPV